VTHREIIGSAAYPYDVPSKVACFWLEPTDFVEVSFRRYCHSDVQKCQAPRVPYPGHPPVVWGYHDAETLIGIKGRTEPHDGSRLPSDEEKTDPRWATACVCGYVFAPDDHWQIFTRTLYLSSSCVDLYTLHNAPIGAMYNAHWLDKATNKKATDGKCVVLKTPAGDWWIDGPANNGPGWDRTGVPPFISCSPSIAIGGSHPLHGWLRNGVLEIDSP
jgi:hypothetical protein